MCTLKKRTFETILILCCCRCCQCSKQIEFNLQFEVVFIKYLFICLFVYFAHKAKPETTRTMSEPQMELAVKFLKHRLKSDHTTFLGNESEKKQILDLIMRTVDYGESNSALIIGSAGTGKTTVSASDLLSWLRLFFIHLNSTLLQMISSILSTLLTNETFRANTMIVNLNGYIHTDDAAALKSITKQMRLETAVNGKVFTAFADNLAFLLDCLKSGDRSSSKSVIFILEEFDLFCAHGNQTLIYNLFDVAQSAQAPISVIGLTRRNDVIELLEKRVKSRFSHRQIFLFNENCEDERRIEIFLDLLKLPDFQVRASFAFDLHYLGTNFPFECFLFFPSSCTKRRITKRRNGIAKIRTFRCYDAISMGTSMLAGLSEIF